MREKIEIWLVAVAATVTIYIFFFTGYAESNHGYAVLAYLFWIGLYILYKLRQKYKK